MPLKKSSNTTQGNASDFETRSYFNSVVALDDRLGEIIEEGIQTDSPSLRDYDRWLHGLESIRTELSLLDESKVEKAVGELGDILHSNLQADRERLRLEREIRKSEDEISGGRQSFWNSLLKELYHVVSKDEKHHRRQAKLTDELNKLIDRRNRLNQKRNDLSDRFNARRDTLRQSAPRLCS